MKKILKWTALVVLLLAGGGFLAFLYFIPPFFSTTPEEFSKAMKDAAPPASDIADPLQRAMAEHGREIVMRTGCIGCHAANGPNGPDYTRYLAGGGIQIHTPTGTFVSRNLTPDPETGLAAAIRRRSETRAPKRRVPGWPRRALQCHAVGEFLKLDGRRSSRGSGVPATPETGAP